MLLAANLVGCLWEKCRLCSRWYIFHYHQCCVDFQALFFNR